jgi:hypothetical protein
VFGAQKRNTTSIFMWIVFAALDVLLKTYLCMTQDGNAGIVALITTIFDLLAIIIAYKAIKDIKEEEYKKIIGKPTVSFKMSPLEGYHLKVS